MGDLTEHFSEWEFECGCHCGLNVSSVDLIQRLQVARALAGIPFVISSGTRCLRHNKAVGGVDDSSHLTGKAVDIRTRTPNEKYRIIKGLFKAGFTRIKLGRTFVHADIDEDKIQYWFGM